MKKLKTIKENYLKIEIKGVEKRMRGNNLMIKKRREESFGNFVCWKCKKRTALRIKMNLNGKGEVIEDSEVSKAPLMACCNNHLKFTRELMELEFKLNSLKEMRGL